MKTHWAQKTDKGLNQNVTIVANLTAMAATFNDLSANLIPDAASPAD